MFSSTFTVCLCRRTVLSLICVLVLANCSSQHNKQYKVKESPLASNPSNNTDFAPQQWAVNKAVAIKKMERINDLSIELAQNKNISVDENYFSNTSEIQAAVETMALVDFIHHSLGGVLGASYVISDDIKNMAKTVTLNMQGSITQRDYYRHIKEILKNNNAYISFKENVFYIYPLKANGNSSIAIGIGRDFKDIPATNGNILQIIPLQFGIKIATERTLNQLTKAKVTPDFDQSTIFVQGSRSEVRQVIDLVVILDRPANRAKQIGFLPLEFITADEFAKQVVVLLENEGIPAGVGKPNQKNVVLVPLSRSGGVAIFASNLAFLERVESWAKKLDQPPKGEESQFFIYHPKYARAKDLGDSLTPLFGGTTSTIAGNNARDTKSAVANKVKTNSMVSDGSLKMVVDERANMVIFETSGVRYQGLLPLIKRLDVMPKQVLLEATIIEVTLTDEFKQGVEFNLKDGNFDFSTNFGGVTGTGLLNWAASGNTVDISAMKSNKLVNVLSNPTLLVRDGTTASIIVGDEVAITSSTDLVGNDNDTIRTNVERRQTGISLKVTPTINTTGVVIMEIEQKISNADEQTISNREISTEVVANSGQTIILGGLISVNENNNDSKVPFFGDIPLIGNLFKSTSESDTKTELVILVTPKIIVDEKQWHEIKRKFTLGLENVSF